MVEVAEREAAVAQVVQLFLQKVLEVRLSQEMVQARDPRAKQVN